MILIKLICAIFVLFVIFILLYNIFIIVKKIIELVKNKIPIKYSILALVTLIVFIFYFFRESECEPFEKSMKKIYGSQADLNIRYESDSLCYYNYNMYYNNAENALSSFLSLTYEVDSIMNYKYTNVTSYPDNLSVFGSWTPLSQACGFHECTEESWTAKDNDWNLSVRVNFDKNINNKGEYIVSFSYTKGKN